MNAMPDECDARQISAWSVPGQCLVSAWSLRLEFAPTSDAIKSLIDLYLYGQGSKSESGHFRGRVPSNGGDRPLKLPPRYNQETGPQPLRAN